MSSTLELVTFTVEDQHYAIRLSAVDRVVWAVEFSPLPKAPEVVLGIINAQGRIIPVVNVRKRFGLREREVELSDQFLIARTTRRTVALLVDSVKGVVSCTESHLVASERILPGLDHVEGVIKLPDGMVFVHDLEQFLSLEEEQSLERVMESLGQPE